MARPKKNVAEKQDSRFPTVRCTKGELASLKTRAAQAGMTMSEYVRTMALNGKVTVKQNKYDFELVDQLRRVGVNINQQTKIANATGELPPGLRSLWRRLEGILDEIINAA